jgi:TRAP transporter TAXI family solute receptor
MDADSSVTGSGAAVGTPHYMAPEQAGGLSDRASQESDVYSMGAILFACLTGRPPIVADSVMQTLLDVVHNPAPPVRSIRSEVPVDLETIVAKCLEKNPTKRYRSAEKLANDLDAFLLGRPIDARPRSKAMKAWHWMEGVPLVGALTGRRMLDTSVTHRRVQAAMLLMFLMTPLLVTGMMLMWQRHSQTIPSVVRVAGGVEDGIYNDFSQKLADRVKTAHGVETQVIASGGSVDNRDHLLAGLVDLAPMQATAITGDHLCVVAPLFYELLYVLARTESGIMSMADLRGRDVAVGPIGSGSRATAELVLASLQMTEQEVPRIVIDWSELSAKDTPEAAMLCIGRGSSLVKRLLSDGRWRLIPIENGIQISLHHPTLRPMTIESNEYRANNPSIKIGEGLPTVGTTAYLAAREDSPSQLVIAALGALYATPTPFADLIPQSQVAEWQGLAFHPAARHYFLELSR